MSDNLYQKSTSIILKRLILIKNLISLEEVEELLDQLDKIMGMKIDEEVEEIIRHINMQSYGNAVSLIDNYLNKNNQLAPFVDPEIEALRFEAKTLERQIQILSDEKSELEKLVHEFNVRHNQELGELILKILSLRKKQTKNTSDFEEAEKDYHDYFTNYEILKNDKIPKLTDEEQKELRDIFRKASKLCHPDIVEKEHQETAQKIFIELKEAYENNDLRRVTEIFDDLIKGTSFTIKSNVADKKSVLQKEIERLRFRLKELMTEVSNIKTSAIYITINSIEDWDFYFDKTKQQLRAQLNEIENGE